MSSFLVRALELLTMLAMLYRIYVGARGIWDALMDWDRKGQDEQARLELAADMRRRRQVNPWLWRARQHEQRVDAIRAELAVLYARAAQRPRRSRFPVSRVRRGPSRPGAGEVRR